LEAREGIEEGRAEDRDDRGRSALEERDDLRLRERRHAHRDRLGLRARIEVRGEEMRAFEDRQAARLALLRARDELRERLVARVVARGDRFHRPCARASRWGAVEAAALAAGRQAASASAMRASWPCARDSCRLAKRRRNASHAALLSNQFKSAWARFE